MMKQYFTLRSHYRLLVALSIMASLLVSCAPQEDKAIEIEFWAMGREGELAPKLIQQFTQENPDIRVRVQQIPWTAAHEKLLTAFAGDALPDVVQLGNTWIAEFAAVGALAALNTYEAKSSVIYADDYFHGVWQTNWIDNTLYGLPWYVDTRLLFYRRDLLQEAGFENPPETWAEWRAALVAIKSLVNRDTTVNEKFSVLLPLNEFMPQVVFSLQQQAPLLRDQDQFSNFSDPQHIAALEYYLNFFRANLAPAATESEIANVWNEFARGYFSFYISGPWNIGEFRRRLPLALHDKWATAPMPGPQGLGTSIAGGSSIAVIETSEHKSEAFRLLEFLSRPDIQLKFYAMSGNLPARLKSWQDPLLAGDKYAAAFFKQLERVKPVPRIPEWERIAQEIKVATERAVNEKWSAETTANEIDRRANLILAKRRWMLSKQEAHP